MHGWGGFAGASMEHHQIVEVAKGRQGLEAAVNHSCGHGTRGCFAVGPGQGDDGKIPSASVKRSEISEGCKGILHGHTGNASLCQFLSNAWSAFSWLRMMPVTPCLIMSGMNV